MKFLQNIPPYLFFTGKGGVGKTSISCATAISLAEQGKRVLLVSTDPASNVGQVFSQTIGNTILPVASVPGLSALEIDPQAAAQNIGPESLILSKAFCRMMSLTVLTNSSLVHVPPKLQLLMNLPVC